MTNACPIRNTYNAKGEYSHMRLSITANMPKVIMRCVAMTKS